MLPNPVGTVANFSATKMRESARRREQNYVSKQVQKEKEEDLGAEVKGSLTKYLRTSTENLLRRFLPSRLLQRIQEGSGCRRCDLGGLGCSRSFGVPMPRNWAIHFDSRSQQEDYIDSEQDWYASDIPLILVWFYAKDLVPGENVEKWLKYLRNEYPTLAFKCSTQKQKRNIGHKNTNIMNNLGQGDMMQVRININLRILD